jgi:hypothetical protein
MHYHPASGTVSYQTAAQPPAWPYSVHQTNLKSEPTFTALDWLAALTSPILVHLKRWDLPPRPPPTGIASSDTLAGLTGVTESNCG